MVLQSIWFFIWGLLWAVFFMTDGFDFGIGTLYPFLGKSERDKRVMLNAMGPLWDGNEVWLILGGGVLFAIFPFAYASLFSGLDETTLTMPSTSTPNIDLNRSRSVR